MKFIIFILVVLLCISFLYPVSGLEITQSGRCLNGLKGVQTYIKLYQFDHRELPDDLESLFDKKLGYEPEVATFRCFDLRKRRINYYNIYGMFLYKEGREQYPKEKPTYCYFFHRDLIVSLDLILLYCNNHKGSIPVLYIDGRTEYLKPDKFQELFDKQGKLLKEIGVDFSFEKGIIP